MKKFDLRPLALLGARVRINQLTLEIEELRKVFPEIGPAARPIQVKAREMSPQKRGMTVAARKKISRRMRQYWQKRRAGK